MRTAADHRAAGGIDQRKRADSDASGRCCRGGTRAAFEIDGGGAEARADAAEREVRGGARGGLIAEFPIGRITAPVLVAAIEQIEQDLSLRVSMSSPLKLACSGLM